jgi:hypothetical protein
VAGSAVPSLSPVDGALGRRRGVFDHRPRPDQEHPGFEEAGGYGVPGSCENPRVGLPRHPHALGRRVLVEPLEVGETDGLEFVEANRHRVGFARRLSDGAEAPAFDVAADATEDNGTRHVLRAYAHNVGLSTLDLTVAVAPLRDPAASASTTTGSPEPTPPPAGARRIDRPLL